MERESVTESSRSTSHRMPWLLTVLVLVTVPLSLSDTFVSMIHVWINSSNFNHCFLILPASIFLIWQRRQRLSQMQPAVSVSGLFLIAAAGLLWILGFLSNVAIIQNLAAVAFMPLTVWTLLGRRIAREIAFPLLYLFFMIPFGDFMIPRLMDFTADFTVAAVRFSGIPIYRDGLFLTIPSGSFKVVDACSGVRMLIASVAIGVLFAHVAFSSWNRRIIFLVATVFLAMLANGLRAYAVVLIGHFISMEAASDHMLIGYIFFGIIIVILLVVGSLFSDKQSERPEAVDTRESMIPPSRFRGLLSAAMIMSVVVLTPMTASALQTSILGKQPPAVASLPAATGSWMRSGDAQSDWAPVYIGNFEQVRGRYSGSSADVDLYAITYRQQTQESELINSQNSIFDPEVWIQIRQNTARTDLPSGEAWQYIETELLQRDKKRLIRHWYLVNGQPASGQVQIKLMELANTVRGRPSSSSVIAISTEFFGDVDAASATLDDFYRTILADAFGEDR